MENNKKKDLKSGFTLIELLVVIAIIGILSSIVYVSLGSARAKSKDKVVQTQLASMKMQAEIYYDQNNNSYSDLCATSSDNRGFDGDQGLLRKTKDAAAIVSGDIVKNISTSGTWQNVTCHASATAWAVEAPISTSKSGTGAARMYCIDSTPNSIKEKTTPLSANATSCQ